MAKKYIYMFGAGQLTEGNAKMRDLLGGKGSDLAEMALLGIPVPPGFTITTEACIEFYRGGGTFPTGLWEQVEVALGKLESAMGFRFGDPKNPLLISVRSGARVSMPGMMDTVLNLGLNDSTVQGLARRADDERFALDCYRRFLTMFSSVVLGVRRELFEEALGSKKEKYGAKLDMELAPLALKELIQDYKGIASKFAGVKFPQDPKAQIKMAIEAVFNSWNGARAVTYRKIHSIPDDWGTAVNVQTMVFGNMGNNSCTGVAFTRDPATGEKRFFGEYLANAQGEDVVAGIRTPLSVEELKLAMPQVYRELVEVYQNLERHYKDMQDIEFTVQQGKLYLLQTRTGKRTAAAAVRIAVDMVNEGLIDKERAILRIDPGQIDQLLHPMIDPGARVEVVAKGLPASPGAAVGQVVFDAADAEAMASKGEKVILVRLETSPEDIGGMNAAQGILTARGGMTSHAAVVARGMGKPCVVGCGALEIDYGRKRFSANSRSVNQGDFITINGATGEVILGKVKLIQPQLGGNFLKILEWADKVRKIGVRANADTPHDCQVARNFGAEGIGLCRTEHMFFQGDRINAMREMILAETDEERKNARDKILPMQRGDFKEIFRVMDGLPVTIRLLDPPLHEFLPKARHEVVELAAQMQVPEGKIEAAVERMREFNPMLGHRGCRVGISHPDIYDMQIRAIFEAACELTKEKSKVIAEVMVPLIGHLNELLALKERIIETAKGVMKEKGVEVKYLIGTMIELPRAALTADEIAREADFFSFGTNDLTQTVFGLSRDDAVNFLPLYLSQKIYPKDPFVTIDQEGVGLMMEIGVEKGRGAKPGLKIGICGEHGGDPDSVKFCHRIGLDYVSCSPFRVLVARLAGAQAALKSSRKEEIGS